MLLARPEAAAAHSRLAWALGRGIGEYLLQQVDWALQVGRRPVLRGSCFGHMRSRACQAACSPRVT
jgi:hypothetical protein